MAAAYVQSNHATQAAAATTLGCAFASNVAQHSVLLAMVNTPGTGTTQVTSLTDSLLNSWSKVSPSTFAADTTDAVSAQVWICKDSAAGANTVTANFNGSLDTTEIIIHEVSGCDNSSTVDSASAQFWSNVDPMTTPSITTAFNGDYIFSCCAQNSSTGQIPVTGSGFTTRESFGPAGGLNAASEDQIQTSAGSIQGKFTNGSGASGTIHVVALKASGATGGGGGGWGSSGTRRAPAKAGPFDQRGFILSPYQRYSYVPSVTTFLVSSADGFTLYEALDGANAIVSAAVQEESLASVAQAQAVITEALASLSQSATVQEEALQGLALVQSVIEEALASATGANTVREEATGLIALGATVQDEALASTTNAFTVQDEALATASVGQIVNDEALASATLASTVRYEALATALLAQIVQYEAGGIVTSPVSNSVTVILEALASATQSATNRLEALQQIAIAAAVLDEVLAGVVAATTVQTESTRALTSSLTVQAEAILAVVSALTVILESGGLTIAPLAGINSILFAAMVTLAALDLMVTSATADSLATTAASDSLTTSISFDSLTTTSAFDG